MKIKPIWDAGENFIAEEVEEEDDDVDEGVDEGVLDEGVDEGVGEVPAATTFIFIFMPPEQCPGVPQAKYLVPALLSFTTLLPPLKLFTGFPMLHAL